MIRSLLATALFTGVISSAYSVNVIHHFEALQKKQLMNASSTAVHKPKVAKNFTDFSGTWEGVCNFDGDLEEDTMTIETGDNFISIDEQVYSINTMRSDSYSYNEGASVTHSAVDWNDDGSKLIFNFVEVYRDLSSTLYIPLMSGQWEMSLSLDEGALVIQAHADNNYRDFILDCRMNKVDGHSSKPVAINQTIKQ